MHRILFICGCVEMGKDGVGDYTRNMAIELQNANILTWIVSINDISEKNNCLTNATRILSKYSISYKQKLIDKVLKEFQPTIISLQFVPYSFHHKGIIRAYLPFFKSLSVRATLHIMFHELWIDIDPSPSIKTRVIGYLQRRYIKKLVQETNPILITTSNSFYVEQLRNINIRAVELPLLSNIQLKTHPNYSSVQSIFLCTLKDKDNYFVVCFFGSIYDGWDYIAYFEKLLSNIKVLNKQLMILAIGKFGNSGIWESLCQYFLGRIFFRVSGQQNEETVSTLLSYSDIGISTTPTHLIGKSGSFVAMAQHGLKVLVPRNFYPNYRNDMFKDAVIYNSSEDLHQLEKQHLVDYNIKIKEHFIGLIKNITE